MAKQILSTREELEGFNRLVSKALSRRFGPVDVKLEPFEILPQPQITKSHVFGAFVQVVSSASASQAATVSVPSKLVIKQYIPGLIGTSDEEDITDEEFMKEFTVLERDIGLNGGTEKTRIYPQLYSQDVPECSERNILIREFIPGKNLEQIANEQARGGKLKWVAEIGEDCVSDALFPIALLHVKGADVARALYAMDLLVPEEMDNVLIANNRSERFKRYTLKLLKGSGEEIDPDILDRLKFAFLDLDMKVISTRNLLGTVDGELDTFAHHAMRKRLLDAGGVEVGGIVRDLAVYGAPCFNPLWESLGDMPEKVRTTYLSIRRQFEEDLRFDENEALKASDKEIDLGILLACFAGNFRRAAAVVHYNGREDSYPVEKVTTQHLTQALRYLETFNKKVRKDDELNRPARLIYDTLRRYGLGTKEYKMVIPVKENDGSYTPQISESGGVGNRPHKLTPEEEENQRKFQVREGRRRLLGKRREPA